MFDHVDGIATCPHCGEKMTVFKSRDMSASAVRCNECDKIFALFGHPKAKDQGTVVWDEQPSKSNR